MKQRRGRPKGTVKPFATDPDRYIIGCTDGLLWSGIRIEVAATLALNIHGHDQIKLPPDPLQWVRRLGLSPRVQEFVRQGYRLQQWGPAHRHNRNVSRSGADRIRKKMARFTTDPAAARWRYYMGMAWAVLLNAPHVEIVEAAVREIGEMEYFERVMLPFVKNFLPPN